jgi:RHS repeat-associated protein
MTYSAVCVTNVCFSQYRTTGKERDIESNLDYFPARYYNSNLGRWMSPDRLNVTDDRLFNPSNTLNKYVYGANNPLKYTDPDGQDITVFYEKPSGMTSFGHVMFVAANQQTGDAAAMSSGSKSLDALLHTPRYMNLTVSGALAVFAPSNENNTAAYQ